MQTSIKKLTNEHEEWKNTLAFYRDEIKFFRNRLDEVSAKNNGHDILENIEHFQNQIDINDQQLSVLKHDIDKYVHHVFTDSQENGNHVSNSTLVEFETLRSKMAVTTDLYNGLKNEFKKFLEKVM